MAVVGWLLPALLVAHDLAVVIVVLKKLAGGSRICR
jgi:hypothetical protein